MYQFSLKLQDSCDKSTTPDKNREEQLKQIMKMQNNIKYKWSLAKGIERKYPFGPTHDIQDIEKCENFVEEKDSKSNQNK